MSNDRESRHRSGPFAEGYFGGRPPREPRLRRFRARSAGTEAIDYAAVDPDPVALRGLVELVEQGRLRVHVQETFPFERVADAHRLLDGGHLQGKLVLTV